MILVTVLSYSVVFFIRKLGAVEAALLHGQKCTLGFSSMCTTLATSGKRCSYANQKLQSGLESSYCQTAPIQNASHIPSIASAGGGGAATSDTIGTIAFRENGRFLLRMKCVASGRGAIRGSWLLRACKYQEAYPSLGYVNASPAILLRSNYCSRLFPVGHLRNLEPCPWIISRGSSLFHTGMLRCNPSHGSSTIPNSTRRVSSTSFSGREVGFHPI